MMATLPRLPSVRNRFRKVSAPPGRYRSVRKDARTVLRNAQSDLGSGAERCLDGQPVLLSVDLPHPLVDVGEPDPAAAPVRGGDAPPPGRTGAADRRGEDLLEPLGVHADAVVLDADRRLGAG